jgi:AraC family transcriptional regulator, regulatory protein of adaptative response / DNA-3-methyladenine glycosylase II
MSYVYVTPNYGLYCRPGCGPNNATEERHPVAASAEAAGLRPCLECRPYRLPQSAPQTAPELVCRGVRLIVDGALDQKTEAGLAGRLGLSGRHLRRLFVRHIGVTPDELARSSRAHFARRLLDDTDLSITEVAFTSGYGSARQFNREFRRVFGGTPSEVRLRRLPTRLADDDRLTLRLWFTGPLDWDAMIRFLAARAVPGVEHVDGRTYRRTIAVNGGAGLIELTAGGPDYLNLRARLPRWEALMHVAAQARKLACLDADLAEPIRSLAADRLIGPLIESRPGVRVPAAWDPFEVGIAAILGQRLPAEAASALLARIVGRLGRPAPELAATHLTHVFPAPATLAQSEPSLLAAGLTSDQAQSVVSFAAAHDQGTLRLDGSMTREQLAESLQAVPGVSASTADYIALRAGEPDAFPAEDPALRQVLGQLRAEPSRPLARDWRPWRSYAAAHLWAAG